MADAVLPVGRARGYAWGIVLGGLVVLAVSAVQLSTEDLTATWLVLPALAAISGLGVLRVHSLPANFSVGDTFSFAAMFLFGPAAGALTSAVDSLACNFRLEKTVPVQMLFNLAAPSLSIYLAGTVAFQVLDLPLPGTTPPLGVAVAAVVVAAGISLVLQTGLVAVAIGLQESTAILGVWRNLLGLWLDSVVGAYVGFLVAYFHQAVGLASLFLLVPIPLMLYFGFKTWLGRLDDQVQALARLNRSYHSVVESLAVAVDAKDEVTHGHIRRVQTYGRALADHAGVTDPEILGALDVASLLHDVGKLGIPERILNKPGKLTPAEFEQMKQHVEIGTRILSTVEFPFPILPIVRHHHENWDGTGYPDGIAGEDIPIGARILMIVDCFDALTSDRPYRSRLSTDAALAILVARRGTMYDAALVDAFVALQPTLEAHLPPAAAAEPVAQRLTASAVRRRPSHSPLLAAIAKQFPGWLCTRWEHLPASDRVIVSEAVGPGAHAITGHELACGAGVSGWVVANGQAMHDCDGRLDLAILAREDQGVVDCISLPLTLDGRAGALTLYRLGPDVPAAATHSPRSCAPRLGSAAGATSTKAS